MRLSKFKLFIAGLLLVFCSVTVMAVEVNAADRIHFINLYDEADAILLESNDEYALIDGGDPSEMRGQNSDGLSDAEIVLAYLRDKMNLEDNEQPHLKFILATHPHSDHFGALPDILAGVTVDTIYYKNFGGETSSPSTIMPDAYEFAEREITPNWNSDPTNPENTDLAYRKFFNAVKSEGASVVAFDNRSSEYYKLSDNETPGGLGITFFNTNYLGDTGPGKELDDINETSIPVAVTLNGRTALLTADLYDLMDTDLYNLKKLEGYTIRTDDSRSRVKALLRQLGSAGIDKSKIDLLKLAHHGYAGSNTKYLNPANGLKPSYMILTGPVDRINNSARNETGDTRYLLNQWKDTPVFGHGTDSSIHANASLIADLNAENYNLTDETRRVKATSGWMLLPGLKDWIYLDENGNRLKDGWFYIGKYWYCFDTNGLMRTGFVQYDSPYDGSTGTQTYYIYTRDDYEKDKTHPEGAMFTGWMQPSEKNGKWYYFRTENDETASKNDGDPENYFPIGSMATSWIHYDREGDAAQPLWYYLNADGSMATGWIEYDSQEDQHGKLWYYLRTADEASDEFPVGSMVVNWYIPKEQNPRQSWFYLRTEADSNVTRDEGNFYPEGSMVTGWLLYDNPEPSVPPLWYFLAGNGEMVSGWLSNGGHWYYLRPDSSEAPTYPEGSMVTGVRTMGGITYTFEINKNVENQDPPEGSLLSQTTSDGTPIAGAPKNIAYYDSAGNQYLNENGQVVTGWHQGSGPRSGASIRAAGSQWYYYRTAKEATAEHPLGSMVIGRIIIDGNLCEFDENGVCISPANGPDGIIPVKHTIRYILNGGKNHGKNPKTYQPGKAISIYSPTRVGYKFAGWYTDSKFKKRFTRITITTTGNLTLYAKWTANRYKVRFSAFVGTKYWTTTRVVTYGKTFGKLPNLSKKGYTFTGWYTAKVGGRKITANTKVGFTRNIVLYAHWYKGTISRKGSIRYVLNGGRNSGKNPKTYTIGKNVKLHAPTRAGYKFVGWYSDRSLKHQFKGITKNTRGNLTVYARWTSKGRQKPVQNKPGKNKPGQNKPDKNKPVQNKPGKNKPGQNKPDKNKPVQNKPGKGASVRVSVTGKGKDQQMTVQIGKVKGAYGYHVVYSSSKTFKNAKSILSRSSSVKIRGLRKGTYYVKVRSYAKSRGKNTTYGTYSTVIKITIK